MESNNNINQQGIATFLRTVVDVSEDLELPYYFDENHRFSRTPQELESVHFNLCDRSAFDQISPYTHKWKKVKDIPGLKNAEVLTQNNYRYFCIQSRDTSFNVSSRFLTQILAIHKYPLYFPSHANTRNIWGEGVVTGKGTSIELPAIYDDSMDYLPNLNNEADSSTKCAE
jgi:hypothetical protein